MNEKELKEIIKKIWNKVIDDTDMSSKSDFENTLDVLNQMNNVLKPKKVKYPLREICEVGLVPNYKDFLDHPISNEDLEIVNQTSEIFDDLSEIYEELSEDYVIERYIRNYLKEGHWTSHSNLSYESEDDLKKVSDTITKYFKINNIENPILFKNGYGDWSNDSKIKFLSRLRDSVNDWGHSEDTF